MVEVVINEQLERAHVVRVPGERTQVHIGQDMHLDLIKEHVGAQLSPEEFQKFEQLWSDDEHPRNFEQGENYLKIMDKE
jgi:hypothetical protein